MIKKENYNKIYFFYDFLAIFSLLAVATVLIFFLRANFYQVIIKIQHLPELSRGVVRTDIDIEEIETIRKDMENKSAVRSLRSDLRF